MVLGKWFCGSLEGGEGGQLISTVPLLLPSGGIYRHGDVCRAMTEEQAPKPWALEPPNQELGLNETKQTRI